MWIADSRTMALKRCCFILPLESGCLVLILLSIIGCVSGVTLCSLKLRKHRDQRNEDNVILMSLVIFCTLSAASQLLALYGVLRRKIGYVQLSEMSNAVCLLCIALLLLVSCLFSPHLAPLLQAPEHIVVAILLFIGFILYSFYYMALMHSLYNHLKLINESIIPV